MSTFSNYHCHSAYSDGQGRLYEYVKQALALGMQTIGFSEHAPVPFNTFWNMPVEKVKDYLTETDALKSRFAGQIELYAGLEVDYYAPWHKQIVQSAQLQRLDYFIASIHFLQTLPDGKPWNTDSTQAEFDLGFEQIFNSNGKKLAETFFAETVDMINLLKPDIIGHIDKIKMFNVNNKYFDENAPYYRDSVQQALVAAKNQNCIVELNTRGIYRHPNHMPYPSLWLLKQMKKLDIPVCLSSDCHSPYELILDFDVAAKLLAEAGYTTQLQLIGGRWTEVPLS